MEYKIEIIETSKISPDENYRVSTERSIEDLKRSIRGEGLITPPLLAFKEGQYFIVSGFQRVKACLDLNISEVYCRVVSDFDDFTLQKYAVLENRMARDLNTVELSMAVSKLLSHLEDDSDKHKKIADITGIAQNPKLIEKLISVSKLPFKIKDYLADDSIPLATALELGKIDEKTSVHIGTIFHKLKMSLNIQKEILTNLTECAKREKISFEKVLSSPAITEILERDDTNRNEKTNKLRYYLKKRRYPNLTKAEEVYESKVKELNIKKTRLIPPRNFESPLYQIQIGFESATELKECIDELESISKNPAMDDILKRES